MNRRLRNAVTGSAAALLVLVGIVLGQVLINGRGVPALAASGDTGGSANVNGTIEVAGTGYVKVKPDIAVLNIGVMTNGETTAVQEENTKTMNSVIASIKALGIDEKDIKTANYYMNPEYDYSDAKAQSKIIGYTVYNVIEVKVRDISMAGKTMSAATDAGANINNGISFRLSESQEYYNEALALAVADAKSKAEALAGAIGVDIGLPAKISENSSYYSPPMAYTNYDTGLRGAAESAAVAIEQGELEITASITVSYTY